MCPLKVFCEASVNDHSRTPRTPDSGSDALRVGTEIHPLAYTTLLGKDSPCGVYQYC